MNQKDIEYLIDILRELLPDGAEAARLTTLTKHEASVLYQLQDILARWLARDTNTLKQEATGTLADFLGIDDPCLDH